MIEPQDPSHSAERRFSPSEVEQFARDGFIIVRGMAGPDLRREMFEATLEGVRGEIPPVEYEAELHYPGAPRSLSDEGGRTIRRLKQAHGRHNAFTRWVSSPELVERLRQLLGPEIVMPLAHHNCIMTKQPQFSSDTGWHQDIRYWSYQRPELVSVWLSLTPETEQNGCLYVIPGSHLQEFDRGRVDESLFFRDDLPENQALIAGRVAVDLDPGDVLFFHCRTLHAAGRNQTASAKYSVVFTFRPGDNPPLAGTRSASQPEVRIAPPG